MIAGLLATITNMKMWISRIVGFFWAPLLSLLVSMAVVTPCLAAKPLSAFHKGFYLSDNERYEDAIKYFSLAIKQNPKDAEAYAQRGYNYLMLDRNQESFADCNTALKLNPNAREALVCRGYLYMTMNQLQKGIDDCTRAMTVEEADNAFAHRYQEYANRSKANRILGNLNQARQDQKDYETLLLIKKARTAREEGRLQDAVRVLSTVIKRFPKNKYAYQMRGVMYNHLSDFPNAIADLTKAISINPKLASAFYFRADVYMEQNNYKKAIEDYSQIIALNPRTVAHFQIAETGREREKFSGKDEKTIDVLDVYYLRGRARQAIGDLQASVDDFTKVIRGDPTDVAAWYHRGVANSSLKKYKLAIEDFSQGIKLDPKDWNFYMARARAYEQLGEARNAIGDCTTMIKQNPTDPGAYFLRAQLHGRLNDFASAISDYSRIIEMNTKDDDAYKCRGDMHLKTGDLLKAVSDFSKAIALDPERNVSAYECRAIAYARLGKSELQRKDEERARKLRGTGGSAVPVTDKPEKKK